MTERERVAAVTRILKKRFNNLTADEVLNLAFDVLEVLDEKIDSVNARLDVLESLTNHLRQ